MHYRLGLLGRNISASLSPAIFEWAFRATGEDGEYRLFDMDREPALALVSRAEWDGLNVTAPHKLAALHWCDEVQPHARATGAVNTLFRRDGAVWGENTDVAGFEFALKRVWSSSSDARRVLVIGAGGAARAVLVALRQSFALLDVTVACRDPQHVRNPMGSLLAAARCVSLSEAARELSTFDLVVQATPVGSVSTPGVPLPEPLEFKAGSLVVDLLYAPRRTQFLAQAQACGAATENGLVMLLAQAAASFEIWLHRPFPLERALTEFLPSIAHE